MARGAPPIPRVSIVIPVCNGARFVGDAIDSVLNQTFPDIELILVDDGSIDSTPAILQRYRLRDRRVRIVTQKNRGAVAAETHGYVLARGEYIAHLDHDDVALPTRIASQVEFLEKHPSVAAVGGAVIFFAESGKRSFKIQYPVSDQEIRATLPRGSPFIHSAVTMRRTAFEEVGGYRIGPCEDYDLWLRMAERFQLANLEEAVVRYRLHDQQITARKLHDVAAGMLAARAAARVQAESTSDPASASFEVAQSTLTQLGVPECEVIREQVMLGVWYAKVLFRTGLIREARTIFRELRRGARAHPCAGELVAFVFDQEAQSYYGGRKPAQARLLLVRAAIARWGSVHGRDKDRVGPEAKSARRS